jgi:peptide chain release factor 3
MYTSLDFHIITIHNNRRFKGVLDRMENIVHLFDRAERGAKSQVRQVSMDDLNTLKECINDEQLFNQLLEDQEMLEELISPLDMERVMAGSQSPLFFGSAMTNFGVQLFLDKFCGMGAKPATRLAAKQEECNSKRLTEMSDEGDEPISAEYDEFTGFVFKTQVRIYVELYPCLRTYLYLLTPLHRRRPTSTLNTGTGWHMSALFLVHSKRA